MSNIKVPSLTSRCTEGMRHLKLLLAGMHASQRSCTRLIRINEEQICSKFLVMHGH